MSKKGTQTQKALSTEGISSWIKPGTVENDNLVFLTQKFQQGCPCPGVSAVGGRIVALERADNAAASEVMAEISARVSQLFIHNELRKVAKWLNVRGYAADRAPRGSEEFICAGFTPGVLIDSYGLFTGKKASELRSQDWEPYKAVLKLDAIYRHLRNSLAHSSYRKVVRKRDGEKIQLFFFQDSSRYKKVSARMYLSKATLEHLAQNIDCGGIHV